jgi:hypothetical protein
MKLAKQKTKNKNKIDTKNITDTDLRIRIGTKDQRLWEEVLHESLAMIEQSEKNLKIQREVRDLARRKIAEEEEKLKYS